MPEGDIIKFNPGDECVVPPGTTVYFPAGSISNPVPPGTTYEGTPVGGGFTQIDGTPVGGITETGGGFTGVDGTLTVDGDGLPGYGSGYVFVNGGQVSAPVVPPTTVTDSGILSTAADNVGSSDQYPVIMALSGVQIDQTGIGYNPGDTVTVSGFDGNGPRNFPYRKSFCR